MDRHPLRSALLATALGAALSAHAATLYDNLSKPSANVGAVYSRLRQADQFLTDGSAYALSSVTLKITNPSGLVVTLWSDASGGPGTPIAALGAGTTTGSGLASFAGNGLALAANSAYWLVATRTSDASNYSSWSALDENDYSGAGVGYSANWAASLDGAPFDLYSGGPYQMSVVAAPVPEPSALVALGLGAVALVRRRRRA